MPQQKYPVFIFIHGGGYQNGGAQTGYINLFKSFISTGMIMVSIQYRLNVFGNLELF